MRNRLRQQPRAPGGIMCQRCPEPRCEPYLLGEGAVPAGVGGWPGQVSQHVLGRGGLRRGDGVAAAAGLLGGQPAAGAAAVAGVREHHGGAGAGAQPRAGREVLPWGRQSRELFWTRKAACGSGPSPHPQGPGCAGGPLPSNACGSPGAVPGWLWAGSRWLSPLGAIIALQGRGRMHSSPVGSSPGSRQALGERLRHCSTLVPGCGGSCWFSKKL